MQAASDHGEANQNIIKVLVGAALVALSLSQMGAAFAGNAHAQVSPDKSATSKTALHNAMASGQTIDL
jgi:hypothetical protein